MKDHLTLYIGRAIEASRKAYVPYSNYQVGALLVTKDGTGYTGCNVENASYPASICAERTALVKAVSEGEREFAGIVVATANGGSPCGVCRQMLYEFSPEMAVITVTFDGDVVLDTTLEQLLPSGFGPNNLPRA
ncbi:MAG: cytidine deaminase [Chloroflexota bacterium]